MNVPVKTFLVQSLQGAIWDCAQYENLCITWEINPKGKGLVLKTSSSESNRVWFRDPHLPPVHRNACLVTSLDADKKKHGISDL